MVFSIRCDFDLFLLPANEVSLVVRSQVLGKGKRSIQKF